MPVPILESTTVVRTVQPKRIEYSENDHQRGDSPTILVESQHERTPIQKCRTSYHVGKLRLTIKGS